MLWFTLIAAMYALCYLVDLLSPKFRTASCFDHAVSVAVPLVLSSSLVGAIWLRLRAPVVTASDVDIGSFGDFAYGMASMGILAPLLLLRFHPLGAVVLFFARDNQDPRLEAWGSEVANGHFAFGNKLVNSACIVGSILVGVAIIGDV